MKVSHKARHGRKRNPMPHKQHRKASGYSRVGRFLKARWREHFAPRIEDFDGEQTAVRNSRPLTSAIVMYGAVGLSPDWSISRASTADTASPLTHGGTP